MSKSEPLSAKTSGQGEEDERAESEKPERKRRTKAQTRPRNIPVVIDDVLLPDEVAADPDTFRKIEESHTDILEASAATLFLQTHRR